MKRPSYTQADYDAMTEAERDATRFEFKRYDIHDYLETGEIRSHLSLDACMAMCHAESGWKGIREDCTEHDQQWIKVYALVHADVQAISYAAKEFEFRHWMGFCEADVKELMKDYRRWTYFDWKNATKEEGDAIRDKWNPSPSCEDGDESYWRRHWQPYIDRRVRKSLQEINRETPGFLSTEKSLLDRIVQAIGKNPGAALVAQHLKVMMGSSAGRTLLTIQDRLDRKDPDNKFDGARVTLIFDEDAGWPRGGLQGHAATREEAVGMITALSDFMPALYVDAWLRIC